jgi:hypothetical protein
MTQAKVRQLVRDVDVEREQARADLCGGRRRGGRTGGLMGPAARARPGTPLVGRQADDPCTAPPPWTTEGRPAWTQRWQDRTTRPTRDPSPDNEPDGNPQRITSRERRRPQDDNVRGKVRENESAEILAQHGFVIERQPTPPAGSSKRPDYFMGGQYWDNYAPRSSNVRHITEKMAEKVNTDQAKRLVLNLSDSSVDIAALRRNLLDEPIDGLEEVILVIRRSPTDEAVVLPFFP